RRPPASYAQSNCPKCAASWRISKSFATGSISGSLCPWKGPKSFGRNRLNKPLKSVSARFQLGLPKKSEMHPFSPPRYLGHEWCSLMALASFLDNLLQSFSIQPILLPTAPNDLPTTPPAAEQTVKGSPIKAARQAAK